ncbi:MAG: nodulation protein NfeD [Gemmataceae bacterium]
MQAVLKCVLPILAILLPALPAQAQEVRVPSRPLVFEVRFENQAISPATARFLARVLRQARDENAECVVLVLDTPGGLLDSTRTIVKDILASPVPVVVYVAPRGARAASAGVFITLASHVAAMAPGTNIGAAHPAQIGGIPGSPSVEKKGEGKSSVIEQKIINDTVAWAKSLCELRGRNAEWTVKAIKESVSATASEALDAGVIEILADSTTDLLDQINGRKVTLSWQRNEKGELVPGETTLLDTKDVEVRVVEMWWGDRFLAVLANPNVAFLLLILGVYGLLFELYTPGWGVGGTLGVICLVLGFFALAILPVSYVGIGLIAIALAMFIAEAFVTSFGFLTLGGIICMVLGGLMLVESPIGFQRVSVWVVVPVAVATGAIMFFLLGSIVRTHSQRTQTGSEGMIGNEAISLDEFERDAEGYVGIVRIHGELWSARSHKTVSRGQKVVVVERQGLRLVVTPEMPT